MFSAALESQSGVCDGLSLAEIARAPNPFQYYKELQAIGEIFYWDRDDCYLVTSHDLVKKVMADHQNFSSERGVLVEEDQSPEGLALPLFMMKPPEQTRARILAADAFSMQRSRRQWTAYCREAEAIVRRLRRNGRTIDIVGDYAIDVTIDCLWNMIGVPHADRSAVRDIMGSMVCRTGQAHEMDAEAASLGKQALADLLAKRIAEARAAPDDSFISLLVNAERDGDRFSEGELMALLGLSLFGGFEDVIRMIPASIEILADNPGELERLRGGDPESARAFVAEAIRFTSSTHVMRRTCARDVALGGITIPAGKRVVTLIAGSNRDPKTFPDPDRFDVERKNVRSAMTFGSGPHVCIGQYVAREIIAAAVYVFANYITDIRTMPRNAVRVFGNNIGGYAYFPADVEWVLEFA